jgi:hypothetical protein
MNTNNLRVQFNRWFRATDKYLNLVQTTVKLSTVFLLLMAPPIVSLVLWAATDILNPETVWFAGTHLAVSLCVITTLIFDAAPVEMGNYGIDQTAMEFSRMFLYFMASLHACFALVDLHASLESWTSIAHGILCISILTSCPMLQLEFRHVKNE